MVEPPRLPHLHLEELAQADPQGLYLSSSHDGLRFEAVDLAGAKLADRALTECEVVRASLDDAVLTGWRVRETRLLECTAAAVRLSGARWREVEVSGGRYGALDLSGSELGIVAMTGTRIGYLNMRDVRAADLVLEDCQIQTLDLSGARVRIASTPRTRIAELVLTEATLSDVDLRGADLETIVDVDRLGGATVSPAQLHALAPILAGALGISVG